MTKPNLHPEILDHGHNAVVILAGVPVSQRRTAPSTRPSTPIPAIRLEHKEEGLRHTHTYEMGNLQSDGLQRQLYDPARHLQGPLERLDLGRGARECPAATAQRTMATPGQDRVDAREHLCAAA